MTKPLFLICFAIFIRGTFGFKPRDVPLAPTIPKLKMDLFANQTAPDCTTDDAMATRSGIKNTNLKWKNFYVYPDPGFDNNERGSINNAMYQLMQVLPCVKFGIFPRNSKPSGDYVHILKGKNIGCSSVVGRIGGRQTMNLQSPGCMSIGTIMHEMIHALGYHHEQSRPDRDDYVTIQWNNMKPGKEFNFVKFSYREVSTYGVPYDPHSIMHYQNNSFSRNGQATIVAKNGGSVGSLGKLQESDKRKLKSMYGC